jgi:hypothetical protein
MKRISFLFVVFVFLNVSGPVYADPKISNCDISPKEIAQKAEVTVSFDYENVEGGLKEGKVLFIQKFQAPEEERVVTRTSNWQVYLQDLSAYASQSGRFERKFINQERWHGPMIDLTYEFKIIDKDSRESNPCTVKIRPK